MIKLVIADDEPLALIGLQSMIDWQTMDIECFTARNGVQALEVIRKENPQIVITDIKMPLKTGLELLEDVRKEKGKLPVFVMLTSYEEFEFVRRAMRFGAVEYILKTELTAPLLKQVLERSLAEVKRLNGAAQPKGDAADQALGAYQDKFFIRLYSGLLNDPEQIRQQTETLKLDFPDALFAVAYCALQTGGETGDYQQQLTLMHSTMRLVKETIGKQMEFRVTGLDAQHFCILFSYSRQQEREAILARLRSASAIVYDYFNARLRCALGPECNTLTMCASSCSAARRALMDKQDEQTVTDVAAALEYRYSLSDCTTHELQAAFEEQDANAMQKALTELITALEKKNADFLCALDAASTLLYMTYSLVPDGEEVLNSIFADWPSGYKSIYLQNTGAGCCRWIGTLRDGLVYRLKENRQSYKERMLGDVQRYIRENLDSKLTLNDAAKTFNVSTSYLSRLFSSYGSDSFVEYVTNCKIGKAKQLMLHSDKKIYEISDELGYESAFYFSRVFKKVTGCTPRDFMQQAGAQLPEEE